MVNAYYFGPDGFPVSWRSDDARIYQVDVTTDGSGNADVTTNDLLRGTLLGLYYSKGTVTTATTAAVTTVTPVVVTLDSYDVNDGDTYRPIKVINPERDAYDHLPLYTKINVVVSGGQASKTFSVYIVFK